MESVNVMNMELRNTGLLAIMMIGLLSSCGKISISQDARWEPCPTGQYVTLNERLTLSADNTLTFERGSCIASGDYSCDPDHGAMTVNLHFSSGCNVAGIYDCAYTVPSKPSTDSFNLICTTNLTGDFCLTETTWAH